ncbi:hypothetical protein [Rhizobium sp. BK251]|uniref:hypothetical protein n=1 Tax=Rhizobium sp. BK251 TaxID=2512125 RepID=UPI00104CD3DF|nr:hypothetical protein [Rhizobium sp. BK251]TCL70557.1 hypothetical protein EV286_107432 [Rhizobium sp. BK251]
MIQAANTLDAIRVHLGGVYLPVFDERPSDEVIEAFKEHLKATSRPEDFEFISTAQPTTIEGLTFLTGEMDVDLTKRDDRELVPCAICRPNRPKFATGRLVWIPEMRASYFVGHGCCKRHMGAEYTVAVKRYSQEVEARGIIAKWPGMVANVPAWRQFVTDLMPTARAVESAKKAMAADVPGFIRTMDVEFLTRGGKVEQKQDSGLKDDKGKRIIETVHLGTMVGRDFLDNYQPAATLRDVLKVLDDLEKPLPAWVPGADPEITREVIARGRAAMPTLKHMREARAHVEDARLFLHTNNLAMVQKWGNLDSSPFVTLEFRRNASWVFLRADSWAGSEKAYFAISVEDMFRALPTLPASFFDASPASASSQHKEHDHA